MNCTWCVSLKLLSNGRAQAVSMHSLPQNYGDMPCWEELTAIANKAYQMIDDKKVAFIYCENYGEAGAITEI